MAQETVLITGASSGIGLELARLFAGDGSALILTARRTDRLETLAGELRARCGVPVEVLTADLGRPEAPGEIFSEVGRRGVQVGVLVNNAGFGARGRFAELALERQMEILRVNVAALTHLARLYLPGMLERRRGGILNVGSTAAFQPGPNMAVYYATKAYVLSLTEALAEEVKGKGVTISCLCPGPTRTGFGAVADMDETPVFRFAAMGAEPVARIGYRGFRRGKVVVIPGRLNRIGAFSTRLLPRILARKAAGRLQA